MSNPTLIISKSISCIIFLEFNAIINENNIKIRPFDKNNIDYCFYGSNMVIEYIKQQNNKYNDTLNNKAMDLLLKEKLCNTYCGKYFDIFTNDHGLNFSFNKQYILNKIKSTYKTNQTVENNIIVVDFSSPNIAKDMHVGHLRSTIIGDSVCNLLEKLGNKVYRTNHLGDYGTPVGMVIQYLIENPNCMETHDLQQIYSNAKQNSVNNNEFLLKSHENTLKLQNSDPQIMEYFNVLQSVCYNNFDNIYNKLNINIEKIGESFYGDKIKDMLDELNNKGLLAQHDGMTIMHINNHEVPLILVKSNGSYTYDTTDLAAIRYRLLELKADEIYYVIDSGQSLHCNLIFEAAKTAGWLVNQRVQHINFGVVLDKNGKKIKSREGIPFKLTNLLDEAISRAGDIYDKKNNGKTIDDCNQNREEIVRNIGIAAVKYFDLKTERTLNYKFSLDNMLSLNGNSAVYILYMYVRLGAIINKTNNVNIKDHIDNLTMDVSEEHNLGKHLMDFNCVISECRKTLLFNKLCNYLYKLTKLLSDFYNKCRCIEFDNNGIMTHINYNSLVFVHMSKNIMEICFDILGIKGVLKM